MLHNVIKVIHSLEGESVSDIFKKFSLYINTYNDSVEADIEDILKSFVPENNLEKLLKLKLIDKWQRTAELVNIFQEDDIYYTNQALKCKWFFTNILINCPTLVNEILPTLSYSIRIKFIRQYSKHLRDASKAEEMFCCLRQRYGTDCALTILPGCTPAFITNVLHNTITQIKSNTINHLFRFHPDVVIEYFLFLLQCKALGKRLYQTFSLDRYGYVFLQIASKYPERFLDMYVKYNKYFPNIELGNKFTKRILKSNKLLVLKKYDVFNKLIKFNNVKRYLNVAEIEEIQAFYFPKIMSQFFQDYWTVGQLGNYTSHFKENVRQEILLRNFKKLYGREFSVSKFSNVIDLHLMLFIPTEMRVEWIQSKLSSLENDSKKAEYLCYLPPELALPALKDMISRQKEYNVRAHMVKCMFVSSSHYKGSNNSLVDCLSFVVKRLRNDNIAIRDKVFNQLQNMKDELLKLSTEGWSLIDELIDLIMLSDEINYFKYCTKILLSMKIQNYFIHGILMEDQLLKFLNYNLKIDTTYQFDVCKGTPYQKTCLKFFILAFSDIIFSNEESKEESEGYLFIELCEYNHLHKNDTLEFPEWLLCDVEKLLVCEKHDHYNKTNVLNILRMQPQLKNRMYRAVFPKRVDVEIIMHLLHKDPLYIKENNEVMMNKILSYYTIVSYTSFFKALTLFSCVGLPQLEIALCTQLLKAEGEDIKKTQLYAKPNAIIVLSILLPANTFLDVITPYKPTKEQLSSYSEDNRLQYMIQNAVATSMKYVSTPSKILSYMKSIAVGDYLKLIVGSINSICLKVSERNILPLLIEWLDCPVSLRKHFIRAYFKVAPLAKTGNLIVSLLDKEKNVSLRLLLLQNIYKFFLAEPSEESFIIFKTGFSQLTPQDVAAVDDLFNFKNIPDMFVPAFINMLWEAVEQKEGPLVIRNKNKIINMIDADILSLLSEEFYDILFKHIFSNNSLTEFLTFITLYILSSSNEISQIVRLDKVTKNIKMMIQKDWNNFNLHNSTVFQTRSDVNGIIEIICQESICQKEKLQINPVNVLERLKSFILSILEPTEIIDEILRLDITIFILSSNINSDTFVNHLANFYGDLLIKYCSSYGDGIITTVVNTIPYSLTKYKLKLAKLLLYEHTAYQLHLMAIKIIDPVVDNDIPTYKLIIEFLLKSNHPSVKVAAGVFLRELTSSVHIS